MDKDLPNNDPWQMNDLPLPDQEAAWQNMKQKLEEEEGSKRILPPFFLNCAGWTIAILAILLAGYFILDNSGSTYKQNKLAGNEKMPVPSSEPVKKMQETPVNSGTDMDVSINGLQNNDQGEEQITSSSSSLPGVNHEPVTNISKDKANKSFKRSNNTITVQPKNTGFTKNELNKKRKGNNAADHSKDSSTQDKIKVEQKLLKADSLAVVRKQLPVLPSLEVTNLANGLADFIKERNQDKRPNRKFSYSAGVGLQQQVPFSGQSSVPYNYYGRKGSISDYIPSVFVSMEKPGKWFLMGEFRFGAPQTLKEIAYNRKTIYDTTAGQFIVTTMNLKKTYYHQLPLSFNFYIKPNLSLGVGGIYSRFYGAVTEREIKKVNLQTQHETVTKQIARVQHFTDSFLYKTQLHLLAQAQYHWNRFSVGLRYTKDIQPYIRYTKPDGRIGEQKNQTFQLMVKYSLWKSQGNRQ